MSDAYLKELYYNPKKAGSYGGITALWNAVKTDGNPHNLKYSDIKKWLSDEETYSLHKPYNDKFKRETIIVGKPQEQFDSDILVLDKLAKYNKGIKYLAVFIDLFSRKLWVEPLKKKTPEAMIRAMKKVFNKGSKPDVIRTDQDKAYTAKATQKFFEAENIKHFIAYNMYHAN